MKKHTKLSVAIGIAAASATAIAVIIGGFMGGIGALLGVLVDWEPALESVGIKVTPEAAKFVFNWVFTGIVIALNWVFAFALMWYWNLLPWQHEFASSQVDDPFKGQRIDLLRAREAGWRADLDRLKDLLLERSKSVPENHTFDQWVHDTHAVLRQALKGEVASRCFASLNVQGGTPQSRASRAGAMLQGIVVSLTIWDLQSADPKGS
jgi:hypothetical protein